MNQRTDEQMSSKTDQQKELVHRTSPKTKNTNISKRKKKKTEKILPQDQKEKSEHRESSRLRSQPRKNCKIFIPQSKILKQVEISFSIYYFEHKLFQNNMLKNNRIE